jgi:hypothetical protein
VLAIGLCVWLVRNVRVVPHHAAIAAAGVLGAVVLFTLIGTVRLTVGNGVAPRYIYVAAALLIPATALALSALVSTSWVRLAAVAAVLILLSTMHGAAQLQTWVHTFSDRDQLVRARILAAASLLTTDTSQVVGIQPEPMWAPDLNANQLRVLARAGELPTSATVDDAARLYAADQLYVALGGPGSAASLPEARIEVVGASDLRATAPSAGCVSVQPSGAHPRFKLHVSEGGKVHVLSEAGGELHVLMASPTTPAGLPLPDRRLTLEPGQEMELMLTWNGSSPWVEVPSAGSTVMCGPNLDVTRAAA